MGRRPIRAENCVRKWRASGAISSRLSRRAGTESGTTASRKYRSSRKAPRRISSARILLVAERTRTSEEIGRLPPTRVNRPSCRARSTLDCVRADMSPTSSRKRVAPSASSNLPRRSSVAPVNEPRTWPNSSDSISSSGIAAQLTSTRGESARVERRWRNRATSSLPVPFSPVIRTRASVGATREISCRSWTIGAESPRSVPCDSLWPRKEATSARRSRRSIAF